MMKIEHKSYDDPPAAFASTHSHDSMTEALVVLDLDDDTCKIGIGARDDD